MKNGGRMWFKKTGKTSGEPKGQRNLCKFDCTNLGEICTSTRFEFWLSL